MVIGGLPLTFIQAKNSPSLPEDDDRPALEFEPIKSEPIEPAPYEQSPIRDKMSASEQISLITDFVNINADKDDPKSKACMQKMLELVHDLKTKTSTKSSTQPSSSSGTKRVKEEITPADEVMPDANSPEIDDPTRASLSESDNDDLSVDK